MPPFVVSIDYNKLDVSSCVPNRVSSPEHICDYCGGSNITIDPEGNHLIARCLLCRSTWIIWSEPDPIPISTCFLPYHPDSSGCLSPIIPDEKFPDYINRTSKLFFQVFGSDTSFQTPYKHRWESSYRRGVISKIYQLNTWAKRHHLSCGMLSLTSAQVGYTDLEILERFKVSWNKFSDNIRLMGFQYFALYEPHASGLPHLHVMLFGDCSPDRMQHLQDLWVSKYEMNDNILDKEGCQHAFSFTSGIKENIQSLVNYLMKYLSKTVITDILHDPSLVRFHSLFYETGCRLFSSSRYLSYVMRKSKVVSRDIDYILCGDTTIYSKPYTKVIPMKSQNIDNVQYQYELLPFEIKSKLDRNLPFEPWCDNQQIDLNTGRKLFPHFNTILIGFSIRFDILEYVLADHPCY